MKKNQKKNVKSVLKMILMKSTFHEKPKWGLLGYLGYPG